MRYVLLDFDNTLSDQDRLYPQLCHCIATTIHGRYGGEFAMVHAAVFDMLVQLVAEFEARFTGRPHAGYRVWLPERHRRAAEILSGTLGFTLPDDTVQFARQVQYESLCRCSALYDGAAEALACVTQRGHLLVSASANEAEFLAAALQGAGVLAYFRLPHFGPDTIDCAKEGPEFYQALFEHMSIEPGMAVVVDDKVDCLNWARELGAATVLANVSGSATADSTAHAMFTHWNQFPELLAALP